jgi:PD-(D/E)XK endonuclease
MAVGGRGGSDWSKKRRGKNQEVRRQKVPAWGMANRRAGRIGCPKQRGEWAELCFMARAAELGLCVCKPYGDSLQWDVAIAQEARILRVQIKSTTYSRDGSFTCNVVGPGHRGYAAGVLDFVAIYLVPVDVWYIVPFEAMAGIVSLQFRPGQRGNKYSRFMEAWHLLRVASSDEFD